MAPLIPWNVGGVVVASTLGISTMDYAPYAIFCWICPLFALLYGLTGWYIPKASKIEKMD